MAFVLWLGLALVPFLLGKGTLALLYGKKCGWCSRSDAYLTGLAAGIGLTEAAHLLAVFFGWSFSDVVRCWSALTAFATLLTLLVWAGKRAKQSRDPSARRARERERLRRRAEGGAANASTVQFLYLALGLSVLLQAIIILTGQSLVTSGDMTIETVNSFLASDAVYQVNPLTGAAYELGVPLRLRILSLPTLYGALSDIFGLSPVYVVCRAVPVVTLLAGYLVYGRLAAVFFGQDRAKRGIFLLLVSALFWLGSYHVVMDGYGVMAAGFAGTSIRNVILVPYTICMMLQGKWKSAVLCIIAEACIVWTFYGMGVCLAAAVLMSIVLLALRRWGAKKECAAWG